jgi:enoyl-CoA hydratase/carnithine racemase
MIYTGERLTAIEAHDIGLVNHVLPDFDAAYAKALGLANIIGGEKGPIAIRAAKQAISHGINMDL